MKHRSNLKIGEIIEIDNPLGFPASGIYRVDAIVEPFVMLSAGEIRAGVNLQYIRITGRNLPEPLNWLEQEIHILESQSCSCSECKRLLEHRRSELKLQSAIH